MNKITLGQVIQINPSSIGKDYSYEVIEYLDISSVGTGSFSETKTLQLAAAPSRAKRLVKDKDTILATVRPNLRSFALIKNPSENLVVSTGFAVLRSTEKIDPVFLYYSVTHQAFTDYLTANAKGAAYPAVDIDIIARGEIYYPPLLIQRKIALILSAYDDLIENNTRRIRILEQMAQAVYREWFGKVDAGSLPEGWELVKVEEAIVRVSAGKRYDINTVFSEGKVPVLDQSKSGILGYHNEEPGVIASEVDPIIVFTNHTCYQKIVQFPFSAIQNVLPFVPKSKSRDIYWLHYATKDLIRFNDYKGHWPEYMSKDLLLPPEELSTLFGSFVKPLVQQIFCFDKQIANLRRTRDLLLPRLVSGEIDVTGLDIQGG